MALLNEDYPNKTSQSVSINEKVVDVCKQTGLPISQIVESCLIQFARMDDATRFNLLAENDANKVNTSDIVTPGFNYAEKAVKEAKNQVGKLAMGMSTKALIAIGIALLAAIFFMSNKDKD